jgi:hypothetical protein
MRWADAVAGKSTEPAEARPTRQMNVNAIRFKALKVFNTICLPFDSISMVQQPCSLHDK